ncbi:MAG: GDSL-type esterase/lipase family protein [Bacteroidia bacterium]|nr:GDSL-type esterase/lipase family protein [Bacteroidia bacterium]
MRSNHLLQGFIILLISTTMVLSLEGIFGGKQMSLEDIPAWTMIDTIVPQMEELYTHDSLEGEEKWDSINNSAPETPGKPPLAGFYTALDRAKNKTGKARIAYFGDSMIEGDLITQSLRNDLQQIFGGEGVGFVPIASQTYGFRQSIRHRFSDDWKHYNFLTPNPTKHDFGISGELFLTQQQAAKMPGKTWVKYWGEDIYPTTRIFHNIRLFYGKQSSGNPSDNFVLVTINEEKDTFPLSQTDTVNEVMIATQQTGEIRLNFHIPDNLPVYGLSFEDSVGVFVDNFSSRGNSGMNLIQIPGTTLHEFHNHLKYDLVVLQFGLNVIMSNKTDYKFYENGMTKVVKHFQENMPGVDILIVSVGDKSSVINGVRQTDPCIPLIVAAQRKVADETGSAFLDLYSGMGGRNSMIKWVNSNPSLAQKDYTHPNRRGAVEVSNIVRQYLLSEYPSAAELSKPSTLAESSLLK